jgi:hypothetical protein
LAALLGKDCGCDFEFQHEFKDILIEASGPGIWTGDQRAVVAADFGCPGACSLRCC